MAQAAYIYDSHSVTIMKKLSILLLAVMLTAEAWSQVKGKQSAADKQLKATVKATAKRMNDALVKKDMKTFVKTTYPKVVESSEGGLDKLAEDMETQIASMEANNNKIISAWTGEPVNFVDTAGELQCTMPQYMKIQLVNGVLTTQTTLMGFSPDQGKTWYFIDATDKPLDKWRSAFPNISSRLTLKPPPEPKFVAKKGL
jgi:hypothetical protein